eukprot:4068807-Pleurochrysis_carterae.AAC.1
MPWAHIIEDRGVNYLTFSWSLSHNKYYNTAMTTDIPISSALISFNNRRLPCFSAVVRSDDCNRTWAGY